MKKQLRSGFRQVLSQLSHPTAAQEETLENLYFAAMLAPGYHREQVGPTYEECVKKAKELH